MAHRSILAAVLLAALAATPVLADDWTAVRLRGRVLQLVDNQWQPLERGDVVPDDRVIRTLRNGRVSFRRAAETIELGADTQIQIHDRDGKRFTTVKQYFGEVGVEAEVRRVQHFAVQTPELVAVVKGTQFVVRADKHHTEVSVQRGHVAVEDRDTHQSTTVGARQSVSTSNGNVPLAVAGAGKLPVVYSASGKPVIPAGAVNVVSPKDAGKAAYAAAIAAGATPKEAEKASKAAEKETKEAAKAEEKVAKQSEKAAEKSAKQESGSSGSSGSGGSSASSGSSGGGSSGSGGGSSGSSGSGSGGGSESSSGGESGGHGKGHGKDK